MKITHEFAVNTPIDRAWAVLTDLPGIAPCLPGARLTGVDGDVYTGKVKVKVGPVITEFVGTARFVEKNDAGYRGVIDAKGRDARSAGNAAATVTAWLVADGDDRTVVNVDTDLKISGKLAQFGSGMIKEVSNKLLAQFVASLEEKLTTEPAAAEPASTTASEPTVMPVTPVVPAPAVVPVSTVVPAPTTVPVTSAVPAPAADNHAGAVPNVPEPTRAAPVATTATTTATTATVAEPEALDLLRVAGASVYKRLIPPLVAVVILIGVLVYLLAS